MNPKGRLIPTCLCYSRPTPTTRYELWDCPEVYPHFRLIYFSEGTKINEHAFLTEVSGRKSFERLTEEHTPTN